MTATLVARHYATGETLEIDLDDRRRVKAVRPATGRGTAELWIAPAWCDIQVNGGLGYSFNDAGLRSEQIYALQELYAAHGIGVFLPTLVTNRLEDLEQALRVLEATASTDAALRRRIPAYHLEGPFLSPEDGPRGAHPREFLRPPSWDDWQRLQAAAGGRIRMITLAPELPGALPLIERLVTAGVIVAIGHTAATPQQIRDAVRAGATISTHLGNGCHAYLPRHDNYLWEQLACDALWASLICDGHHLPPAVMRSLIRAKRPERVILTCDASSLAGLPAGRYRLWGAEVEVLPSGKIVVAGTPYLAGSGLFLDSCVDQAMRHGGLSLQQAVAAAAVHPRQLLGLTVPQLAVGEPAEYVLFEWNPPQPLRVRQLVM